MTTAELQQIILIEISRINEELQKTERVDYINGLNLALSNLYIALSNTVKE